MLSPSKVFQTSFLPPHLQMSTAPSSAISINNAYNLAIENLYDTFESNGINSGVYEILLKYLNCRGADYAAIENRNEMVRTIAADVIREIDNEFHAQVTTVFGSPGPTHDALQEFLDAWLDWIDSSEHCASGSCACYDEDSTGWCRLDYID